ncbi:MarR family winged helix-turn-helix transcriptional regulator [Streptomyces glomeratus]|uniref:MarR family transcriptional regulator n=1 Tax=Streptomyces glomeratus TaxID=284452 RepID=A0ABP6L1D6_9ACTN|nr:MarR family transcriptional regulator [Streptomyces glomeratus]MCF1511685.1 MarR family transcriptional regulator [Streptomyces glomeratus]
MEGRLRLPGSATDALAALDDLIATSIIGRQEFARTLGLSVTDLVCFAYIAGAGDSPVTAGDLARRAHVTTGAVTGIINRLERGGFVTRRPDPADRRRVIVAATPAAAERVRTVHEPCHALLEGLFADYTQEEIAVLADWLSRAGAVARGCLEESRET